MERYDCIIIGTGPAGLEAALNLKIRNKKFLLFGPEQLSHKIEIAPKIENYLGFPSISGHDLSVSFKEHLTNMEIKILDKRISIVYSMGDFFSLATSSETFETKTVILATGVFSDTLLEGERELLGHGVSYCATCDAMLYKNKTVAVIGYSDEAVREANFLSEIAGDVFYIPAKAAAITPNDSITIIKQQVKKILGDKKVTGLRLENDVIDVDGVFIIRQTIAPDSLVPGILIKDGFIVTDAMMQTNIAGLFAAGDCTGKPHQYMRAAGQGQIAAFQTAIYLDEQKSRKAGQ